VFLIAYIIFVKMHGASENVQRYSFHIVYICWCYFDPWLYFIVFIGLLL